MGVPIDDTDMPAVVKTIHSCAKHRGALFLSTANLNFLALSQRDQEFKQSLRKSDLCLADGVAVVIIARLLGAKIHQRVAGSDIIEALHAARDSSKDEKPIRTYIFGGTEGTADLAKRVINQDPRKGVVCVGETYPGFGSVEEMSSGQVISDINATNPDFVFVALGAQKGQAWIVRNRNALNAPILSHLGATVNFIAGTIKRAPQVWQALGLEWAWRIASEPKLAKRYLDDSLCVLGDLILKGFPLIAWFIWNRMRRRQEPLVTASMHDPDEDVLNIYLQGAVNAGNCDKFSSLLSNVTKIGKHTYLDASQVSWFDAQGMGLILLLWKALDDQGKSLKIDGLSRSVRRSFVWNGLGDLID